MCHKKVGNEEGTRRARANLKDVHWCVTFVYRKLRLVSPTLHCWMLHVASVCTPCCMLLVVVAQTLKPVKLLDQQLPTFLLFRDGESVAQQCWIRLHSSSNIVRAKHAHYTWFTKSYGLYLSHETMQVPTLLGVVASVSTSLPTQTQQIPTLLAQQCWELLRPFVRSLGYYGPRIRSTEHARIALD